MGGFSGIVRGELANINEVAGNPRVAQQLKDRNAQDRNNQLQLALTPLQESLRADQTRLALYANPDDPTKALPGKENEYSAVHNRMADTIGQMRSLYGQKPGGANPVEAAAGNVLDKLHITNHLKNHVAQARAAAEQKYQGQNQAMAGEFATGTPPPNPADLTPAEAHAAARVKGGLDPGAEKTPDMKLYRLPNKQTMYLDAKNPSAIPAGAVPVLPGDDKAPKGKKFDTATGQVVDEDANKRYSKGDKDLPPDVKAIFDSVDVREKAKQDEADKKQKELWDRLEHTEEFQSQMTALREQIHDREQNLALTSKIPSMEANRYTQAQIIQEQTEKIRELLKDPSVTKYMGPIAGRFLGTAASMYSPKVRELFAAQKSLSALLPILHGYRGGVQTQEAFDRMSGNMNVDVSAYGGALKAIDDMAGSIEDQVQGDYPNAPMFKSRPEGPTMRKNRQAQTQQARGSSSAHAGSKPAGAIGTVTYQGKKYWVDKEKNNLGEVAQ